MYDFIIIGSGASGGVVASRLHHAGAKVLLIEAGKHYRKDTFPKTEFEFSSALFWGGGLEFDKAARTAFLRARCVGGTTIVNQSLLNRFDAGALKDWKARSGVEWFNEAEMKPYYDAVESDMTTHTFNESEFNGNARIFTGGANKVGIPWKFLHRGQKDCQIENGNDCIGCLGGCHRDSKQSTLVAFIHKAEAAGMEILSEFEVGKVEHSDAEVTVYGEGREGKKTLKARRVVLAAGSFGSTGIMLRSGYLSKLPGLGEGFTQHPQYMSFGLFDEPVDAHKGAFQTVASAETDYREKGYKLENVYAGPISIGMLFMETGVNHQELMRKYRHYACIEAATRDDSRGLIRTNKKGKLVVEKKLNAVDLQRRDRGLAAIQSVLEAAKAKKIIHSPLWFGLHLMGGCQIGVNAQTAVVNPEFQVHGMKNIYIADSSIFPEAPGINPSFSIMAFSQKLSQQLSKV